MSDAGTVYLVGAGPGDPGLLTLRGLECLQRADLVLYDGLANPLLLRHSSAYAERTSRAQGPDGRRLDQDQINQRMIDAARAGQTVVRLKGGDPFIFGRGSEEAAALSAAGIPFEVVPGITAATAAGEYAGISYTHRERASAVAFITGHEDPAKPESSLDYSALAAFPGTLVFYMGLHRLSAIVDALISAGKASDTPASVVCRASTPFQRTVSSRLDELPAATERAQLSPPSLIVVGECVRQRETIAWFERRPLFGMRIGITRPVDQAEPAIRQVLELGAEPVLLPTIRIGPVDDWSVVDATIQRLHEYDWIVFTSANGVRSLLRRTWDIGADVRRLGGVQLAAIGPATAEALREFHLRADLIPDEFRAEALADRLRPHVDGRSVLWARASRGRDVLQKEIRAAGAQIEELVVYKNTDVEEFPAQERQLLEEGAVDWVGLGSPSIARNFAALLPPAARSRIGKGLSLASISPVTSAAAREANLEIHAEAAEYTWPGILRAIAAQYTE